MMSHQMPLHHCEKCGKPLDAATGVNRNIAPATGDISICAYCLNVAQYAVDGIPHTMTVEDMQKLAPEERDLIARAQEVLVESPLFHSPLI